MNILHVYKDYHPIFGGIEGHIQALAEAQTAAGHHVTVLVTNPAREPARQTINGVQVIRAGRLATVASTPLSLSLPWQLGRLQPDITHLQFPYPVGEMSQLLVNWLARGKRPYIISYQSDVVKQQGILRFYRPWLLRALRRASRILTSSPQYIPSSPYLQPLADKCTAVPLGIDPAPFLNAAPLWAEGERVRILFMGRHRYYKGVDTLIAALPHLPQCELIIGGDGPERPQWEAQTAALGLGERVRFIGNVSAEDLPRLYASADIFCLPSNSRAEAYGLVLLEAMASGLPCVTTELSTGTSFLVQDGVSGFVVPPQEPIALAHALGRLADDAALRRAMGASGRARLLAELTVPHMVARVQTVYEEVLSANHK